MDSRASGYIDAGLTRVNVDLTKLIVILLEWKLFSYGTDGSRILNEMFVLPFLLQVLPTHRDSLYN